MLPVILVLLSVCCICAIILFSMTIFELKCHTCRLVEKWGCICMCHIINYHYYVTALYYDSIYVYGRIRVKPMKLEDLNKEIQKLEDTKGNISELVKKQKNGLVHSL